MGTSTKKATVEEALRQVIKNDRGRQAIANLRGLGWEGDLDQMRQGRNFDHVK
jgi:Arc/MetJ family transcription regulator